MEAVKSQNYELAADFRDKAKQKTEELEKAKQKWLAESCYNKTVIDVDTVAETVAMMSGIPVQRIAQSEGLRLLKIKVRCKIRLLDKMKLSLKSLSQYSAIG